jgi:translation initiation factor 2A
MLFDARCKPVYDLGSGPYNSVFWNPFGRFLAVAGFGNLPGEVESTPHVWHMHNSSMRGWGQTSHTSRCGC